MNSFFRELAQHFPRDSGGTCTRRMNWGEYVHFTSGAAAADMSGRAARGAHHGDEGKDDDPRHGDRSP